MNCNSFTGVEYPGKRVKTRNLNGGGFYTDLSSKNAFSHPASRWLASKVDPVKLEKEISELVRLPSYEILDKLKRAVLEAFKITIQEKTQYKL